MFRHLLVPTDGSDLSRRTATHAITFARETGARITFFAALPQHPVSFHEGYGLTDAGTRERLIATAEQQGRAIVDPLVAEAVASLRDGARRHHRRRHPPWLRPDLHGLPRPPRHRRAATGQRDPEGTHPFQDPGAGAPLTRPAP